MRTSSSRRPSKTSRRMSAWKGSIVSPTSLQKARNRSSWRLALALCLCLVLHSAARDSIEPGPRRGRWAAVAGRRGLVLLVVATEDRLHRVDVAAAIAVAAVGQHLQ